MTEPGDLAFYKARNTSFFSCLLSFLGSISFPACNLINKLSTISTLKDWFKRCDLVSVMELLGLHNCLLSMMVGVLNSEGFPNQPQIGRKKREVIKDSKGIPKTVHTMGEPNNMLYKKNLQIGYYKCSWTLI